MPVEAPPRPVLRSPRWSWQSILVIGALIFFAAFGGMIFGPMIDDAVARASLQTFLGDCPKDQLRVRVYTTMWWKDGNSYESETVDFSAKTLTREEYESWTRPWGLFWSKAQIMSIGPTVDFGPLLPPPGPNNAYPYTDDQMASLTQILRELPAPKTPPLFESPRQEWSMAFWKDEHLCIYHYSKLDPDKLAPLRDLPELGYLYQYWNSASH